MVQKQIKYKKMLNITEKKFFTNPDKVIQNMQLSNDIINIVSDKRSYVIIDFDEWKNISETLYLNNIPEMVKSIQKASQEPLDESITIDKLDW